MRWLYVVCCMFVVGSGYDYEEVESDLDYYEDRNETHVVTRVRRYDPQMTMDPRNEDQVKEALNKIFAGRHLDLLPPQHLEQSSLSNSTSLAKLKTALAGLQHLPTSGLRLLTPMPEYYFQDVVDNITELVRMVARTDGDGVRILTKIEDDDQDDDYVMGPSRSTARGAVPAPTRLHHASYTRRTELADRGLLGEPQTKRIAQNLRFKPSVKPKKGNLNILRRPKVKDPSLLDLQNMFDKSPDDNILRQEETTTTEDATTTSEEPTTTTAAAGNNTGNSTIFTCPTLPTTTTTTTTTTTRTTMRFDIEKFLEIVANLTYDYYTNLTQQLNMTLRRMSAPTCPTLTPPSTEPDYSVYNDSLRAKCFVCGMDNTGVPWNADCADAFAGDFIPLVPQSPKAKGSIAKFRKYCLFKDINNFFINQSMPRMMFGRWTGGCSVRWTDVSGIYTQRTCRSKYKAATGKNYASKRMAKLEMTLQHTENGCVISPVATLLPLSRAISLYARFHACVCTGNWCNSAPAPMAAILSALPAAILFAMTVTLTMKMVTL